MANNNDSRLNADSFQSHFFSIDLFCKKKKNLWCPPVMPLKGALDRTLRNSDIPYSKSNIETHI